MNSALPPRSVRLVQHRWLIVLVGGSLLVALGAATIGLDEAERPIFGAAALLGAMLSSGLLALSWLAAGFGLGGPLSRWMLGPRASVPARFWAQLALGPAALLWIDQIFGSIGLFSGSDGRIAAIGVLGVGLVLLAWQCVRYFGTAPRLPMVPGTALLGVIGIGILLVASASPPGWLWRSEAGGFDAMGYHLLLPQEWARDGARLGPVGHNVYSFLPSYIEGAYLHIAALSGGSLIKGEGIGLLACQYLHALWTLLAALLVGRVTLLVTRRFVPDEVGMLGAGLAWALVLATPWSVVVGSLAYNEMGMLALLAGAACIALEDATGEAVDANAPSIAPMRRAIACALLLGVACGCKPTALFLGGPTIGLLLLLTTPRRAWAGMLAVGLLGGLIALAPALVRNWHAAANPVFPAGVGLFGHRWEWSAEQVARFAKAHGREGTIVEQIARLILPVGQEGTVDAQPRGMLHQQWGVLFPAGIVALIALAFNRRARPVAMALLGGLLAGCVFWVVGTHGQSRFLLPMVLNLAVGVGMVLAWCVSVVTGGGRRGVVAARVGVLGACMLTVVQSATLVRIWLTEGYARPNALLVGGVAAQTGETLRLRRSTMGPGAFRERLDAAPPAVYINLRLGVDESVLLVGDATPIYYTARVVYNTVWDRSPLGLAIDAEPLTPASWTGLIRAHVAKQSTASKQRLNYVLVNFGELRRYWGTYGYDQSITPERLLAWLGQLGEPVQEWMPEQDGLMVSWHDVVSQPPERWVGVGLWSLDGDAPAPPVGSKER